MPNDRQTRRRMLCAGPCCLGLLTLGLLVATAGCRHGDLRASRARDREQSMQHAVQAWSTSEQRRPALLERVAPYVERSLQQHALAFERNSKLCHDRWIQPDVDLMPVRQPRYAETLSRILWGKPEQIERTATILLY